MMLCDAVAKASIEQLQHYLNKEFCNVNETNSMTALHLACAYNELEMAKLLIQKGANGTPLHLASKAGHLEMVQLLVAHGANVYTKNRMGKRAHHLSDTANFTAISQFLRQNKSKREQAAVYISEEQVLQQIAAYNKHIHDIWTSNKRNLPVVSRLIEHMEQRKAYYINTSMLSDLYFEKGHVLYEQQQDEAALHAFEASYAYNSEQVSALNWKGFYLVKKKKYPEALQCFEQVLLKQPNNDTAKNFVKKLKRQ